MSGLSVWMGAHVFLLLHLCMLGGQTAICALTLWVEPHITTDLYIGTLRRRPIAMAPRVADEKKKKKKRVEASLSKSSYFDAKEEISSRSYWAARQILVVLGFFFQKGRKVPPWFDRAVKYLDYGSFPDSSYEMPGGVLSYIRRVHTKLLLLLLLALKTELPIKYSTVHMGGNTQACLPACMTAAGFFFKQKVGWAQKSPITCTKALHVSHINTGTNRHDHRYPDAQEQTLSCGCLTLLHFPAECHSLILCVFFCVCCTISPLNSRGIEQHKGSNCSCLNTANSRPRRLLRPLHLNRRKSGGKRRPPIHHLRQVDAVTTKARCLT